MEQLKAFRAVHNLPERYMLFLGTLEPRKNLIALVEAYALLRQQHNDMPILVIAGAKGWYYKELFERILALNLQDTITFAGYVAREEQPLWYSGAEVFVYPSLYEGFGLPPLEAMACGIPVIASNRASLPEVVGDAGLQVEPLDVDALTRGMLGLAEDEGLHQELSLAGRDRASSFTWEKCAFDTLRVYQRAVSRLPA